MIKVSAFFRLLSFIRNLKIMKCKFTQRFDEPKTIPAHGDTDLPLCHGMTMQQMNELLVAYLDCDMLFMLVVQCHPKQLYRHYVDRRTN
jgi:hypothetical protein